MKLEERTANAFYRQLKFETGANHELSISDVKNMFMTGGSVTKVSLLESAANYVHVSGSKHRSGENYSYIPFALMQVFRLGTWTFVEYPTMEEADAAYSIMRERWDVKSLIKTEELVEALRAKKKKGSVLSPPHKTKKGGCGERESKSKTNKNHL